MHINTRTISNYNISYTNFSFIHTSIQMACLIRVPTEVIKQKLQTGVHSTITDTIQSIKKSHKHGLFGLYTGFGITILREIPFSLIQFPLYEFMKVCVCIRHIHYLYHTHLHHIPLFLILHIYYIILCYTESTLSVLDYTLYYIPLLLSLHIYYTTLYICLPPPPKRNGFLTYSAVRSRHMKPLFSARFPEA